MKRSFDELSELLPSVLLLRLVYHIHTYTRTSIITYAKDLGTYYSSCWVMHVLKCVRMYLASSLERMMVQTFPPDYGKGK